LLAMLGREPSSDRQDAEAHAGAALIADGLAELRVIRMMLSKVFSS
jgi:hypothetical protein